MRILLVDDDQALMTVFQTALSGAGFEVVTAVDGKSGIDKAKTTSPDLILLDQMMPDMNGNDMLKMLKQDPETKHLPIAMLSNYSDSKVMQEAIQAGALDYILKYQIEPRDLVTKVQSLLQESTAKAGLNTETPAKEDPSSEVSQSKTKEGYAAAK